MFAEMGEKSLQISAGGVFEMLGFSLVDGFEPSTSSVPFKKYRMMPCVER